MNTAFLSGVIEGFYGPPWSREERQELFRWMADWGLGTYVYGPKDDLHHRVLWRQSYPGDQAATLGSLIADARARGIDFWYALGPGLDLRYASVTDRDALRARIAQMQSLGCRDFCLLFDDIPDRMHRDDEARWGSFAAAQCGVVNDLFQWTRRGSSGARFLFCPTPYCGRMASRQLGGPDYLETIGATLDPEIGVFWTGPEIVSRAIPVEPIHGLTARLRRPPVLWDNLQANDYDGHRFFAGPFSGRPLALRQEAAGVLLNPNTEFPLNYIPIRTLAAWICNSGDWDPRTEYLKALAEWHPRFEGALTTISLEDLTLLMDCYYLPYETGDAAEAFREALERLLARDPSGWGRDWEPVEAVSARLREACVRMTELRDRPLFHALSRRIWELREELDLVSRFVRHHANPANRGTPVESDFHQPHTYRGGFVATLQRLLRAHPDGSFTAAPSGGDAPAFIAP
ncbi:MAG: beta-N-acetylglucosaminidase domain-containing protein [Verrucomicrobiae bacterium]|nr:beta-N-acetylglucosaminidase domain-containing protein [Verrucomicrobiae bacterium]